MLEYFEQIKLTIQQLPKGSGDALVIFAIVFTATLFNFFWKRFCLRLQRKFAGTKNTWDDALIDALSRPVSAVIWVIGLSVALEYTLYSQELAYFDKIALARRLAIVILISWFAIRFTMGVEKATINSLGEREREVDATTVQAVSKLVRVSIVITTILVLLQNLNISISGVLAFGGIGGIAVGFAAKDLLANFFGGLIIYLDRPFSVGDWIRSPDRSIEGTVEHIGWRQTRIRTFDKRPLYVPNATFNNIAVENPSRMSNRRIYETIGIRYCDSKKMDVIVQDTKAMLKAHPAIDQNTTLIVNFNAFGPSSMDFFVYTFTKTTNWVEFHEIKQEILLKILAIVHRHDADVAFPTTTVHLENDEPLTHTLIDAIKATDGKV